MASPEISILIITYNRDTDCAALLENIAKQNNIEEHVGEILLLNNHSSQSYNNTQSFIKKSLLPIEYIYHDENLGVAKGRNFLIQKAKYPILLIIDDDIEFAGENALETVAGLFKKAIFIENNTAAITLNIHYFETRERQKNALPHKQYEEYKDKEWFLTYYFVGAAHVMRKELFEKTGCYPTDFFYGMEEYDLSYRIVNAGYSLAYDNAVVVWHKESPSGRVANKEKMAMLWYNKSKVAWKYLPGKYFYSTALMWSIEYLRKTKFDIKGYFATFNKIRKIPSSTNRQPINISAMKYLREVKARLWY